MVPHVLIVSIMMIVNGSLVSLMGLLWAVVGPAMFLTKLGGNARGPQTADQIIGIILTALGVLVLLAGLLNIIAGILALRFRGRVFAIVALFCNVIPLITFYCAPTSLGLMIYGLIVLFNAEVAEAFRLAAEGVPPNEIRDRFAPGRYRPDEEEEDEDYQR